MKELNIDGNLYIMNADWDNFTSDGALIKASKDVILIWDINDVPEGEVFIDVKHFIPISDIVAYADINPTIISEDNKDLLEIKDKIDKRLEEMREDTIKK